MAEHHRRPRSGNRHANKTRAWNPPEDVYDRVMESRKRDTGWSMTGFLTECLKAYLGLRKDYPERPQWAKDRAAALPDDDPVPPDDATET